MSHGPASPLPLPKGEGLVPYDPRLDRGELGTKGEGMRSVGMARRLRREATDAERRLWARLRNRQVGGVKFRRQVPIDAFIADFASVEARLVIEVDGSQHADAVAADRLRSDALSAAGYLVLRFWNNDVLDNIDGVVSEIENAGRAARARRLRHQPLTLSS